MNAVVIGAAKPGYAEAITRKLIKNGFKVIGTYDTEFEENATKLSKEFSSEKLTLKSLDLSSRNDLKSVVDEIVDLIHELKNKMNAGSSIVILTSAEGFRGSYGASAYAATKAAIHNLVKTLANNLGKRGIRINALPAGWIGGEMDTDEIFNKSRSMTPLGRLGTDEEIANVTCFLLSKESSFVNGTTIVADGGYLCSDPLSKYEFEDTFGR